MATPPPIPTIEDFAAALPQIGPLLGFDVGTKTIGIAISDDARSIATGLRTLRRTKFSLDVAELLALAAERRIVGVVVGLPLNMDGSSGPRAQASRAFVRNLAALTPLPIALWDERLSTVAAERTLIATDTSRRRRAEIVDAEAAAFILQGVLDRLRHLGS